MEIGIDLSFSKNSMEKISFENSSPFETSNLTSTKYTCICKYAIEVSEPSDLNQTIHILRQCFIFV